MKGNSVVSTENRKAVKLDNAAYVCLLKEISASCNSNLTNAAAQADEMTKHGCFLYCVYPVVFRNNILFFFPSFNTTNVQMQPVCTIC
jgi:hypothetical protein